jgi:uncharacterized damage-inducible protein DinB
VLTALFDHLVWADARTLEALRAMPPDGAETARAWAIYAHLAAAAHTWLARLEGRTPVHPVWPALEPGAATALAQESAAALRARAAACDAAELARPVAYRTSSGAALVNTVGEILAHVALHGSYHRGQLALLARQGGGAPAVTDFIAFARAAAPPRADAP